MTIIFGRGDEFYIERLRSLVTLSDAAGFDTSAVTNLERSGDVLSFSTGIEFSANTTNSQAVGTVQVRDQASGLITHGGFLSGIIIFLNKQVGTGATVVTVITTLFMRRPAR